ncbi:MAG: hypothetical protein P8P30_04325 [Rickettsiales bacterium]|nr:hypothetical protein [Rickettsiales bacterium]
MKKKLLSRKMLMVYCGVSVVTLALMVLSDPIYFHSTASDSLGIGPKLGTKVPELVDVSYLDNYPIRSLIYFISSLALIFSLKDLLSKSDKNMKD